MMIVSPQPATPLGLPRRNFRISYFSFAAIFIVLLFVYFFFLNAPLPYEKSYDLKEIFPYVEMIREAAGTTIVYFCFLLAPTLFTLRSIHSKYRKGILLTGPNCFSVSLLAITVSFFVGIFIAIFTLEFPDWSGLAFFYMAFFLFLTQLIIAPSLGYLFSKQLQRNNEQGRIFMILRFIPLIILSFIAILTLKEATVFASNLKTCAVDSVQPRESYKSAGCLAKKASDSGNYEICKKTKGAIDLCYEKIARSTQNAKVCDFMSTEREKVRCLKNSGHFDIAQKIIDATRESEKDITRCQAMEFTVDKDICFTKAALALDDLDVCLENVSKEKDSRYYCLEKIFLSRKPNKDVRLCDAMKASIGELRNKNFIWSCFFQLKYCDSIPQEEWHYKECIKRVLQ